MQSKVRHSALDAVIAGLTRNPPLHEGDSDFRQNGSSGDCGSSLRYAHNDGDF
jgi:hypothetical protein